jgi:hypothetical protein
MTKKSLLVLLGCAIKLITNAQEVITTSGGSMTNSKVLANWTIGEPVTETNANIKYAVTAGLNQPALKIETSVENIENNIDVTVFPNPTSQFVTINYGGQLPVSARILTLNGTLLFANRLKGNPLQLDLSNFESGVYIIEIADKSGKSNTFRIVKL